MKATNNLSLSIGIMAYNEEGNIGKLIEALLKENISSAALKEIVVVASGCTDNTVKIVECYSRIYSKVTLLRQTNREGKASAINLFLSQAASDIVILESGDTLPKSGTIEKLVAPFLDQEIGMTGARPIPVNDRACFMGFVVHLMWALHHKIALAEPKMGEVVAFRKFIQQIPNDTAVDEACIEALVKQSGYNIVYVPDAIVYNKGPETAADFLKAEKAHFSRPQTS